MCTSARIDGRRDRLATQSGVSKHRTCHDHHIGNVFAQSEQSFSVGVM